MTDDLRSFLKSAPKDWLETVLYDLLMDAVDREVHEAEAATGALSEGQTKAVVMRRMKERLRRTFGRVTP